MGLSCLLQGISKILLRKQMLMVGVGHGKQEWRVGGHPSRQEVIRAGGHLSGPNRPPCGEQSVPSCRPRLGGRGLGKAATASGSSELTGHGSSPAELTNLSPEAALPPAKPNPVWPHGLRCLSQRNKQTEVNQHSQLGAGRPTPPSPVERKMLKHRKSCHSESKKHS